jgi:uncharacterized membrane protein
MRALRSFELSGIEGGAPEGTVCGAFVGVTVGLMFFNPLASALVFMFTPLACVLDFGLHE